MHSQLRRQRQVQKQQEGGDSSHNAGGKIPFNSANHGNKKFGDQNKKSNNSSNGNSLPTSNDPNDERNGGQGYTLILRGLTTDLATIYRDAIPRFLLPRIPIASATTTASAGAQQQQEQEQNENENEDEDEETKKVEGDEDENGDETKKDEKKNNNNKQQKQPTTIMRSMNPDLIAFRAETCSAFVSISQDEAEKALRHLGNNNEEKKQQQKQNNMNTRLAKYCKHKDLFGARVLSLPATSNHDQSGLVSISASISKPVTSKHLASALQPIEGFVSVIQNAPSTTSSSQHNNNSKSNSSNNSSNNKLLSNPPSRHFRLVFKTEKHMFGAKKLLDEFPAAEGVKVNVQLNHNDNVMRRFMEYMQQEEAVDADDVKNNQQE